MATEIEQVCEVQEEKIKRLPWNGVQLEKVVISLPNAPMIFVIPFPTMVETPGQENQRLINGGD